MCSLTTSTRCVIRISKILLYAIHNNICPGEVFDSVVLSGFQRYFCMQYTTVIEGPYEVKLLCYQDFKDTFVCNTQPRRNQRCKAVGCVIRISKILLYAIHNQTVRKTIKVCVVLSGFQRYFCMQYTTQLVRFSLSNMLCYQDFKDLLYYTTQARIGCNPVPITCYNHYNVLFLWYTTNFRLQNY